MMTASHGTAARKRRRTINRISLLVIAACVLVIGVTLIGSALGGSKPAWKARVQDYVVINPADLAVTVRVTNTGKAAGTPTCTVQAQDAAAAYTGFDTATLKGAIQPGSFAVYVDNVTITHQGAKYVTQVTVSC